MKDNIDEIDQKEAEAKMYENIHVLKTLMEFLATCEFHGVYPKAAVIDHVMLKHTTQEKYAQAKERLIRYGKIVQNF